MHAEKFNHSGFSIWINSKNGRIFRISAGVIFFIVGVVYHKYPLGIASLIWSFFPLSAGGFDLCYISKALGGPINGTKIRKLQSNFKAK